MTPLLATHYRPQTQQYLKCEGGKWFIYLNGDWVYTKKPFTYELVEIKD